MSRTLDEQIAELVGESGEKVRLASKKWETKELAKDSWEILRPENSTEIMNELRTRLALAMVSAIPGGRNSSSSQRLSSPVIGRILVHGTLPHLIWSRSEAYRPIYFFDSSFSGEDRIHKDCKKCCGNNGENCKKIESGAINPRILIPNNWLAAVNKIVNDATCVPPCWPRTFLLAPELCRCQLIRNVPRPIPTFGKWTLQDILALSRLRLQQYALKKRSIVRTPGLSVGDNENIIAVLTPAYFNQTVGPGQLGDVVSVTRRAHTALNALTGGKKDDHGEFEKRMRAYVQTFESDRLEEACVWKPGAGVMPKKPPFSKRDSIIRASDFWMGAKDDHYWNWEKEEYINKGFELNPELCALLTGGRLESNDPPNQAIYGCKTLDDHICVYFEFIWPEAATAMAAACTKSLPLGKLDLNIKKKNENQLAEFCHNVLSPWQTALRWADARWENHRTFCRVFAKQTRKALIDTPKVLKEREKKSVASPVWNYEHRLGQVRDLYMKRANSEDDNPVNLALATMGDAWKFALGGILNPQYGHFQRFQQLLKGMPNYRDHLTHSIQVFLLGEKIIDAFSTTKTLAEDLPQLHVRHRDLGFDDARLKGRAPAIMRFQWALTSLMHDFACPAEKVNEVVSNLFKTFIGMESKSFPGTKALRDLIDSDQRKHRAFLYGLLSKTQMGSIVLLGSQGGARAGVNAGCALPLLSEFTYEALAEDHGFLSAVYLFNQLFEEAYPCWRLRSEVVRWMFRELFELEDRISDAELGKKGDSAYWRLAECLILEVLDAIIKHNATAKEYRLFFRDPPAYKKPSVYFSAADSIFGSALPGLLLLCDTLCDSGRIIYPDELARYDVRDGEKDAAKIERPEGQISLDTKKHRCLISVNYEWPLPPEYGKAPKGCLRKTYLDIRDKLAPYTPGFQLPRGCEECMRNGKWRPHRNYTLPCPAIQELERFWSEVLTGGSSGVNRLAFPQQYYKDTFNGIEIKLKFHGKHLRNGSVGRGFGTWINGAPA